MEQMVAQMADHHYSFPVMSLLQTSSPRRKPGSSLVATIRKHWIPASAGMTIRLCFDNFAKGFYIK